MSIRTVPRPPWIWLGALSCALIAGAAGVALRCQPAPTTRVAIRVDCTNPVSCVRAESLALDVWSEHRGPGMPLDVVISSDDLDELAGARLEILVPDIDAQARAEAARLRSPMALRPGDWFAEYKDYRAISERMHQLALAAPGRVSIEGIGSSLDGRTIWALRIGTGTPMLVNGTLHAREWISAMVTTCVADRLVRDYDKDPKIRAFVDSTELWIVPVVNPDGYQHSWSTNRFWRKNRRDGHGVDLNRNFSVDWGGTGSSKNKRSDVYHGAFPFSEPETAALRDLAKREGVKLHIDVHAYGQLLLYPWGYTAKPSPDHALFGAIGDRIASAMFSTHDSRYRLMRSVELYPASGTMTDWAYGEVNALSYTVELRPSSGRGAGGFVLPPEQIRPTCDEGLAAVLALRAGLR